jgi:hypothetical protein
MIKKLSEACFPLKDIADPTSNLAPTHNKLYMVDEVRF